MIMMNDDVYEYAKYGEQVTGKYRNNGTRQSMGELTTHGFVGMH